MPGKPACSALFGNQVRAVMGTIPHPSQLGQTLTLGRALGPIASSFGGHIFGDNISRLRLELTRTFLPGSVQNMSPLHTLTKGIKNVRRDTAQRVQTSAKLVEVEEWPRACPCLAERSPQTYERLS